ncbi:hypothetical protein EN46_06795 [Citrobacter amalonaticus]
MSPETFIRKHVTSALVAEGFPEQVAQGGGQIMALIITADALRPAAREACMRIVSFVPVSGRWGRQRFLSANRQRKSRDRCGSRPVLTSLFNTCLKPICPGKIS